MDAVLKKIELLAEKAAQEVDPRPLDAALVMARINRLPAELEDEEEADNVWSFRLFAGVGAAAVAAAAVIFVFAAGAWMDLNSPAAVIESLMEVMETTI